MIKNFIKKFWPIIFILILWFAFSSPYFMKGKAPYPSSYQVNNFAPWSGYPEFGSPVKNGAMPDVITQIYPWRHLVIQVWKSGQIPLWNPYSFSGTPLLANYQSAVLSPSNLLFFIFPFVDGWSLLVLLQPLLAGFFTYAFVRALKRSRTASLISAVSFMFCGFITSWMSYATLGYAILPLPLALFAIEKYHLTKKIRFLVLLSFSIPLSFFSGHFQISIYFLLFTALYIVFKLVSTKDTKSFIKVALFTSFGILLSMPQLLPSIEFYAQSFRSDIFQKGEVIPLSYLPTLIAPDFFGNPVTRNDWLGHYAEWNGFIGVIPLMFSIYALITRKKKEIFFFLCAGLIAILLAFDTKLVDLMVALKIPVLSTSAASRMIVIYSFMFAVLSAFGVDAIVSDIKERKLRRLVIFLSVFAGIIATLWVIAYFKIYIPVPKAEIAKSNLVLPTLLFAGGLGLIFISTLNKKIIHVCFLFLLVLVSLDMLRFATKWQPFDPKNLVFAEISTTSAFSQIAGRERIMSNLEAGVADYYNLLSPEGYDALYIKRYGEFAASITDGKLKQSYRSVVVFPKTSPNTSAMMNLLGTKYVVHKNADDGAGWTFPVWTYPGGQFEEIYKDNAYKFYENKNSFPRAFLVGDYRIEEDSQEIIGLLTSKDIDLKKQIILEQDPNIDKTKDNIGSAKITKYSPNEIDIEVSASRSGLLFLSDNYYRGWKASINGSDIPIYRANYSFRAVPVKEGNYLIKFEYQPSSFFLGILAAGVGGLGIIIASLFPRFAVRKT
ncbi:MAG: YfhO family protein [Candidatus Levyibacteriota bacterium]